MSYKEEHVHVQYFHQKFRFFHGVFSLLIYFLAFHQFSVSFLVLVIVFFLLHNFHYTLYVGLAILTVLNIYFQFFAGQKLYFRLLQDRLFISGYNNVKSGGQARLLFYFLGHTGQIIYFQIFGGQNIYFQKLPAPPPPPTPETNGRPLSTYCAKREYYLWGHTKLILRARVAQWVSDFRTKMTYGTFVLIFVFWCYSVVLRNTHYLVRLFKRLSCIIFVHKLINN